MSRALNDLDPRIRLTAFEHIARCVEAKVAVMIIDTLRTREEQKVNVANGVSWTMNSLHLPQPPSNLALAYDLCPYEIYQMDGPDKLNWDDDHRDWQIIGNIGLNLGLKWGLIKKIKGKEFRYDLGHFEFRK